MNSKRALRWAAVAVAIAAVAGWLMLGANRGWTKTSIAVPQKDPVTEQDYVVWVKRFVPGVDLLAVGLTGAFTLLIVAAFVPKTKRS
jgi:hypothetical protein